MKYRIASYELWGLAVIAFVIDHVGGIFFPDEQWFRVFRLFALVWFFPIGYNSAWRSRRRVWAGLVVITLFDAVLYPSALPLCALATLLIMRPLVDLVMAVAMKGAGWFWSVQIVLLALIVPTNEVVEYGTMAMILAIGGWLVRHKDRLPPNIVNVKYYMVYMTAVYLAFTQYIFQFTGAARGFVIVSTALTACLMMGYKDMILEDIARKKNPDFIRKICQFIAHNTLEIYVLHLVVFKLLLASIYL